MKTALILLPLLVAGCLTSSIQGATTGSSAGSTSASSTASSSGMPGSTGTSSGGGTAGGTSSASGTGSGTGTTTGSSLSCPPGATRFGNTCVVNVCSPEVTGAGCILPADGIGECYGTQCLNVYSDPLHCGSPEVACPIGMTCVSGTCAGSSGCVADGGCPVGDVCQADGRHCLPSSCDASSGQRRCNDGVCCGDTCTHLDGGTDCGACGVTCADGGFCYSDPFSGASTCGDCASVAAGTPCNGGICCGGACVDDTADVTNCGGCGRTCVTDAGCNDGACVDECGTGCPAGKSCRQEGSNLYDCVSDTCAVGEDGYPCGKTGSCCGGACMTHGFFDPQNCAACGRACPDGDLCDFGGLCIRPSGCQDAPSETLCILPDGGGQGACCDGQCVDITTTLNCGECFYACTAGATCTNTGCSSFFCTQDSCPAGTVCTSGGQCFPGSCEGRKDGDYCASQQDGQPVYLGTCCAGVCGDSQYCGGCGLLCPAGTSCFATGCTLPGFGQFRCGGEDAGVSCASGYACVSTYSSYGDSCAPTACAPGTDGDICAYGPGESGLCCGGSCVPVTRDPAHCGGCGLSCPSGICATVEELVFGDMGYLVREAFGVCQPPGPATCTPDCQPGLTCVEGTCVDGLCTSDACITASDAIGACCAGGACIDLASDSANCGGCGFACPSGAACAGGKCAGDECSIANTGAYCGPKNATHACCGNACVDLATDEANCGSCGITCSAGQTCASGVCG